MELQVVFKKMKGPEIFLSFLKVGLAGFGGGSALIPVVERELLRNRGALGEDEYLKHTLTANITPGALPVKLGASCGWYLDGAWGSLAGAWGVTLPGVLLTIVVMALFRVIGNEAVGYFNAASAGISAFIIFLLCGYIKKAVRGKRLRINILICAAAFVLTGGHEVRSLLTLLSGLELKPPLFDISTISLMALALFIIFTVEFTPSKKLLPPAFLLGGAYAFFSGNYSRTMGWNLPGRVTPALMVLFCLAVFLLRKKTAGVSGIGDISFRKRMAGLFILLFLPALACVVSAAVFCPAPEVFGFIARVCLSTLSSFGGGEAYISVADGFFVQSGFIPPEVFYTRLVPAANALPGPILIKIAAGIAFVFGFSAGSLPGACLMAAAAVSAALGICGALAVLAIVFYARLRDSRLAAGLTRCVPPVICGMLLSTACSMLCESIRIMAAGQIHPWISLAGIVGWVVLLFIAATRFSHVPDPVLLLLSACVSLALIRV
ncbi:MAG: chromate transporter [Treponema sp.]|jgi:chromate transporter|nr:chromate transporter [Treponema sp.]